MLGFAQEGAEQLNAFYAVWESMGFLPEEFGGQQHFFLSVTIATHRIYLAIYICLPT